MPMRTYSIRTDIVGLTFAPGTYHVTITSTEFRSQARSVKQ